MSDEKRMAGSYEIINALHIGNMELILGVDQSNKDGYYYMTGKSTRNELFESYDDVIAGDDYVEILEIFTDRLKSQIEQVKQERAGLDIKRLDADFCLPDSKKDDYTGKVCVIRTDDLYPDCQNELYQLVYVTHGNGAKPDRIGQSVFAITLHSGKKCRWERRDVIGVADENKLPDWAKKKLVGIKAEHEKPAKTDKPKDKER